MCTVSLEGVPPASADLLYVISVIKWQPEVPPDQVMPSLEWDQRLRWGLGIRGLGASHSHHFISPLSPSPG